MVWSFLPIGYCISVAVETPILMIGLAPAHSLRQRALAGLWLTACTYPFFILVMPFWFSSRETYLAVGEVLVAVTESALFLGAFGWQDRRWAARGRNCGAIVLANLASLGVGEWMRMAGWFDALAV
jgi:hypothetical protein